MTEDDDLLLEDLSPKALEIIHDLGEHLGSKNETRTIEEISFAMHELLQLIDTDKDPLLEPEAFQKQMERMRGILQRFKRF